MTTKEVASDKIYAKALAKTLSKVASPLTVGLYSSCNSRTNMVLRNIEAEMEQDAMTRERKSQAGSKPRPIQPSLCSTLALISRLLLYRPVWTENNQDQRNVRFVFVRFSAWHFAGSDMLWAGLVMRLCLALQQKFGKLSLGLYRIAQHDEEIAELKKEVEDGVASWRSKKICCFPIWFLLGLVASVAVIISTLLILFGKFPKSEEGEESADSEKEDSGGFGLLEGFAIATLGVPAAGAIRFTILLGKNLALNQDFNIRRNMDNQKMSEKLGFMNEVRKEMRLLSRFIHFMEVFERRKIRVVLEITNLDRCTPQKIVGVLDAINILLSDEESPFISLLAVNPEILVEQVKNADCCYSKRDNASGFLDRIITLPFTVPPLCNDSKRKVFGNIVFRHSETPDILPQDEKKAKLSKFSQNSLLPQDDDLFNSKSPHDESSFPLIPQTYSTDDSKEKEMEKVIQAALISILQPSTSPLHEYISGDTMSMRRVINSIRVTVVIMEELPHMQLPRPERLSAWVVLADRWPCRLSWILQCIEDDQQRMEIDQVDDGADMTAIISNYGTMTLWEAFSQHKLELHLMIEEAENLLERDGDPELFEKFLKVDFPFTVNEALLFVQSTVNLDYSIKRELARLRGSSRLNDPAWKNTFFSLSKQQVINMTVDDICKEMSEVGLPEKYTDIVRSNLLDGRALLFNEPSEVKEVLQMTLGEWTTFRTTFLMGRSSGMSSGRAQREPLPVDLSLPSGAVCPSMPCHIRTSKTTNV